MYLNLLFTCTSAVEAPLNISVDGTICYGLLDTSYSGPLVIPEGVKIIWKYAFFMKTKLTSLKLPQSLEEIQERAFYYCTGLTGSLTIPDSVTEIGDYAFYDCHGLKGTLTLGESVTRIGEYAFKDCYSLSGSLIIPDGVTEIGGRAFYSCKGLTEVHFGRLITKIPPFAFDGCSSLKRCFFYNSNITIGTSAFSQCSKLEYFMEPNRCQYFTIGKNVFSYTPMYKDFVCLVFPQQPPTSLFTIVIGKPYSGLRTLQLAYALFSL